MRRLRTKEQIQTECQIQRIYFTKHYSNINNSGYNWSSVPYAIVAKRAKKKLPSWTKCCKKKSTKIELENENQLETSYIYTCLCTFHMKLPHPHCVQSTVLCSTATFSSGQLVFESLSLLNQAAGFYTQPRHWRRRQIQTLLVHRINVNHQTTKYNRI